MLKLSYMKTAERVVRSLKSGEFIEQVDMLKKVAKRCGTETENIRGAVCGVSSVKLYGKKWFKKKYAFIRKIKGVHNARIYKLPLPKDEIEYKVSYDTNKKEETRERVFKYINSIEKPVVVTMASNEGLDVQHILKKNSNAKIYNIEKYKDVLSEYEKLNLPTINLLGKFSKAILEIKEPVDIVYYDTMGYASPDHERSLSILNSDLKPNYVAIAFINIKRFKGANTEWRHWAEKMFTGEDPTMQWLKYTMFNYEIKEEFSYNQNKSIGGRGMRVFIFEKIGA